MVLRNVGPLKWMFFFIFYNQVITFNLQQTSGQKKSSFSHQLLARPHNRTVRKILFMKYSNVSLNKIKKNTNLPVDDTMIWSNRSILREEQIFCLRDDSC